MGKRIMRMCNHHVKHRMQDGWGSLDAMGDDAPGETGYVATVTCGIGRGAW